jgi:hypothetical protein
MMGFVDYYGFETLRREFVQPPRLEQGLVRCDGPCLTFDSSDHKGNGLANSQISVARCPMLTPLLNFYHPIWSQMFCLRRSLLCQLYAVDDDQ